MALLFIDSFDHYTDAGDKYLAGGAHTTPNGRHGRGWEAGYGLTCALNPGSSRVIVGFAYRPGTTFTQILRLGSDPGNWIATVETRLNGALRIEMFGGPILDSAVDLIRVNQWHYIECDFTVTVTSRVVGSDTLYRSSLSPARILLDGAEVINAESLGPGIEVVGTSPYHWNYMYLMVNAYGTMDDLYICDGSGPAPWNAPLGDVEIAVIRPNGPGALTQWAPTGVVANWDAMNDQNPDDDTTRVTATAPGLSDLYEMQDVNTADTILGAQLLINARRTEEGFATVTPLLRHAGVTYPLAPRAITPTYFYRNRDIFVTMPNGDPLTPANMNALQAGLRREG